MREEGGAAGDQGGEVSDVREGGGEAQVGELEGVRVGQGVGGWAGGRAGGRAVG